MSRSARSDFLPMPPVNILSDGAIAALIKLPKPVPEDLYPLTKKMHSRNRSNRAEFDVDCPTGERFIVVVRQNEINPLAFSVILGYRMPGLTTIFRLCRYNGKHQHSNFIEKTSLRDFHRHVATERYQLRGAREEHYAEIDNRFHNLNMAIKCMLDDCGFQRSLAELPLFDQTLEDM